MTNSIAIIDFGSQYTQLIARRVRELQVYCEIFAWDAPAEKIGHFDPAGFILSGGPASVYDAGAPVLQPFILQSGLPILGICYGMQLLVHSLGGRVEPCTSREYGQAQLSVGVENLLIPSGTHQVWMSHGDRVEKLPAGFQPMAFSTNSPVAAMMEDRQRIFGLQFHPEVRHTPIGQQLLSNFVFKVCHARPDWTPENIIQKAVSDIRSQVGENRVICRRQRRGGFHGCHYAGTPGCWR